MNMTNIDEIAEVEAVATDITKASVEKKKRLFGMVVFKILFCIKLCRRFQLQVTKAWRQCIARYKLKVKFVFKLL